MGSVPDLFHILVQAFALFSQDLDRWLGIPWPLVIGVLFLPIVAFLDASVWYLRGMVFPIPCGYPTVRGRGRCRRLTLGEWHKCWYHSKLLYRKTDNHVVDPKMRRWISVSRQDGVVSPKLVGRGFLSTRSHRDTLLYRQGFARPPGDVFRMMPEVLLDYKVRSLQRWEAVRGVGLRGLIGRDQSAKQIAASDILPGVIAATRLVLVLVALGLLLVGVSVVVPDLIGTMFEYCATLALISALMIARSGIWRAQLEWLPRGLRDAAKGTVGFTGIAILSGLLDLYSQEVKAAVAGVIIVAFYMVAFIVVSLFLSKMPAIGVQPSKRRSGRRRRRRLL